MDELALLSLLFRIVFNLSNDTLYLTKSAFPDGFHKLDVAVEDGLAISRVFL